MSHRHGGLRRDFEFAVRFPGPPNEYSAVLKHGAVTLFNGSAAIRNRFERGVRVGKPGSVVRCGATPGDRLRRRGRSSARPGCSCPKNRLERARAHRSDDATTLTVRAETNFY